MALLVPRSRENLGLIHLEVLAASECSFAPADTIWATMQIKSFSFMLYLQRIISKCLGCLFSPELLLPHSSQVNTRFCNSTDYVSKYRSLWWLCKNKTHSLACSSELLKILRVTEFTASPQPLRSHCNAFFHLLQVQVKKTPTPKLSWYAALAYLSLAHCHVNVKQSAPQNLTFLHAAYICSSFTAPTGAVWRQL